MELAPQSRRVASESVIGAAKRRRDDEPAEEPPVALQDIEATEQVEWVNAMAIDVHEDGWAIAAKWDDKDAQRSLELIPGRYWKVGENTDGSPIFRQEKTRRRQRQAVMDRLRAEAAREGLVRRRQLGGATGQARVVPRAGVGEHPRAVLVEEAAPARVRHDAARAPVVEDERAEESVGRRAQERTCGVSFILNRSRRRGREGQGQTYETWRVAHEGVVSCQGSGGPRRRSGLRDRGRLRTAPRDGEVDRQPRRAAASTQVKASLRVGRTECG